MKPVKKTRKKYTKTKVWRSPLAEAQAAKDAAEAKDAAPHASTLKAAAEAVGQAKAAAEAVGQAKAEAEHAATIKAAAETVAREARTKALAEEAEQEKLQAARFRGIAEGRKQGFTEGRAAGFKEGRKEGYQEGIAGSREGAVADGRLEGKKQMVMAIEKQLARLDGERNVEEWRKSGKLPAYWVAVLMDCWEPLALKIRGKDEPPDIGKLTKEEG